MIKLVTHLLIDILHAGIGNLLAVVLFPVLMYSLRLGVTGAAISTVISQYVFVGWILLFHMLLLDFAHVRGWSCLNVLFQVYCHLFNVMVSKQESNPNAS